jgi:flagellar biosynthetic protein FlhB
MWQRAHFRKRMMMTRQDLKDDMKQTEGDPQVKQQRRQRAMEIAMNNMMVDAAEAAVIVVNPTHYAIALKWDRESLKAPICVAKGVDEIAARIRQIANENAIPIKSDPPTARALHATVDIGDEIGKEHYQAVAAAIRFAEAIRQKARS